MIIKTQSPLSPSIDITFDGIAMNYLSIQQMAISLSENKHDHLKVRVAGIPPKDVTDLDGAPVSLSWYTGAAGHDFRGYVTYVEPEFVNSLGIVNDSPLQTAWIHCLGASFDMHGKRTRVWESPSLRKVVEALALEYQFSFSIPVDDFTFPRLIQSGESDWAFLVRVCDSLGYEVTMHGTHIHVFDRYKSIGRQISYHKLSVPAADANFQVEPGQILSMTGTFGRVTPAANSNTESITSLDNRGVITTTNPVAHDSYQGRPVGSRFHDDLSYNVTSPEHAQKIIQARSRHKFPYEATISTTGVAGVKPGGIVDVDRFTSRFDGLWYVSSVTHTLAFDKFFSEITAHKDSTNDDPFRIPSVTRVQEVPAPVLHNSSWRAKTQMVEVYG